MSTALDIALGLTVYFAVALLVGIGIGRWLRRMDA